MENSRTLATDSFSYSWLINRESSVDNINGLIIESHRPSLDDDDGSVVLELKVKEEVMHAVLVQQYCFSSCPNNSFFLKTEEDEEDEDFDFKINGGADHLIIPADEIFSDGCIKPLPLPVYHYHDASTSSSSSSTRVQLVSSLSSTPISSSSSSSFPPSSPPRDISGRRKRRRRRMMGQYYLILMMRKWSKSSLHKCFAFLSRIIKFGWCSRKCVRVVDFLERNVVCEVGIISSSWRDSQLVLHSQPSPPVPHSSPAGRLSCDVETSIHEAILHCKRSFGQ